MEEPKKYFIYKDARLNNTSSAPTNFYITVGLSKTTNVLGYVDVTKDETIQTIERQEINPYFIEMGFFDGIQRNKVNYGIELTPLRINYIRTVRPDVSLAFVYDDEIQKWFDLYGKFELPWDNVTIDDIDKADTTMYDIVSKASYYPIDINN